MNSLNRFRPAKQFRCPPLVGRDAPFGYVEIVRGTEGCHNYQTAGALVGAFAAMNERGRKEWLKLTGGSVTEEASPFGSYDGSQNRAALSICGVITPTNASNHSISSSAISEK